MTSMPPLDPAAVTPLPYATPLENSEDLQHLKLLSIFHFIVGPLTILFGTFPVIHLVIGILIVTGRMNNGKSSGGPQMDALVGWMFIAFAGVFILLGWTLGVLIIYAGLQLRRHRRRIFCVVIAAIMCAFMPFGTVLGVFTLIVLFRPSVKAVFAGG